MLRLEDVINIINKYTPEEISFKLGQTLISELTHLNNNSKPLIQKIPNDYIKLGREGKYSEALEAIKKHVGTIKKYS